MNTTCTSWQIIGSENFPLFGNTHMPSGSTAPCGVVIMTHGFLGYKDYGFFPYLAQAFADSGFIAHRYNLAHSGMTNNIEVFERPDLFEKDTWNHQVSDINAVVAAVESGEIAGKGLPIILWGHSRGGVSSILALGRRFRDCGGDDNDESGMPVGLITVSAPSATSRLSEEICQQVRDQGYMEIKSNRTGQTMHINRRWLDELEAHPEDHDVLKLATEIRCPLLAVHGEEDPTVEARSADQIVEAVKRGGGVASACKIAGANHVFNTANPMGAGSDASEQLQEMTEACVGFAKRVTEG